jgi:hypothetical protein
MSKNKNCHVKIIESEAGGFRRKNIQAVANALFFHLKFTTINVCSVGDLDPVEVATGIFWWVATEHGSRAKKKIRSRPTTGRDPERKSGRDRGLRSRSGRDFFSFYYSHRKEFYTNRSNRPIGLKIY